MHIIYECKCAGGTLRIVSELTYAGLSTSIHSMYAMVLKALRRPKAEGGRSDA
jgi:hypothetical protein